MKNAILCEKTHVPSFVCHTVRFGMHSKFNDLIKQLVETQYLELHFLYELFFKRRIAFFMAPYISTDIFLGM